MSKFFGSFKVWLDVTDYKDISAAAASNSKLLLASLLAFSLGF